MLLANCIFILAILSFLTWIYQSILLPSIRQRLRFDLFELRDSLRALVIAGRLPEDSAVFQDLHRRLNVLIKAVPGFDWALIQAVRAEDLPALERRALKLRQLVDASVPEVKTIYEQAVKTMAFAMIANSFLWFVWVVVGSLPLIISQGVWTLCTIVRQRIKTEIQASLPLRDQDLDLVPFAATSRGLVLHGS